MTRCFGRVQGRALPRGRAFAIRPQHLLPSAKEPNTDGHISGIGAAPSAGHHPSFNLTVGATSENYDA